MSSQASPDKRAEIRKQVWNSLYDHEELTKPTLPYKNIPNFKSSSLDAGIDRLLELDVLKASDKVLLSMEKSMTELRIKMLQQKSAFYVMLYKSSMSTVCRVDVAGSSVDDMTKYALRASANLFGKSKVAPVEAGTLFDVLVVSSIAVSPSGERIGKTDTLGELEYAILCSLGFVAASTLVVTLVHDLQVVEGVPSALQHNLPVDVIVTPTRVIRCEKRARVAAICWSSLSEASIDDLVILKQLRYKQWKDGSDVRLKGEAEAPTELEEVVMGGAGGAKKGGAGGGGGARRFRSKNSISERKEGSRSDGRRRKVSGKENGEGEGNERGERREGGGFRRRPRRYIGGQRRYFNSSRHYGGGGGGGGANGNDEFKPAVYVGDLPRDMTSESFNDLLVSRDVHPVSVVKNKDTTHAFAIFDKGDDVSAYLPVLEGLSLEDRPLRIELSRQTVRRQKTQQ